MHRVRSDLWRTTPYRPAPDFATVAYLWTPPSGRNVLFAAPGDEQDFDRIESLGGVAHHYLTHRDEAGPALELIARRFGTRLHAPEVEAREIARFAEADVWFAHHHVDEQGTEIIPTPGHSPGSTSFAVTGAEGARYLFVGDTVFLADDGTWTPGYIPGVSDAAALARSLDALATREPDLVCSVLDAHPVDGASWTAGAREARRALPPGGAAE